MSVGLCLAISTAAFAGDMETTKTQPAPTPDPTASTNVVTTQGDMETTAPVEGSDLLLEAAISLAQVISSLI
jgi:hypothetical protein